VTIAIKNVLKERKASLARAGELTHLSEPSA
jgi:hypothetical protein